MNTIESILIWYAAISVTLLWVSIAVFVRNAVKARRQMQKLATGMTGLFSRTMNDPNVKLWEVDGE